MKKVSLKVYATLLAVLALSLFSPAVADDTVVSDDYEAPKISLNISNIILDKAEYSTGEDITGSFVIENHSGFNVSDLSYRIQIGASYKELMQGFKYPEIFLDAGERLGSIDINNGGQVVVKFKYHIPGFIAGDKLGVNINVYAGSGMTVGVGESQYIKIKGPGLLIETKKAGIILSNGMKFDLLEGPTIYKNKEPKAAFVEAEIINKSKEVVLVYPSVHVYESKDSKVSTDLKPESFSIKVGETKTVKIALPDMGYKPGVYFGEVLLLDKSGAQLESRIGVRYIVDGNIATIHSAITDKTVLSQNEQFKLTATLTGKPFDIALLRDPSKPALGDDNAIGKVVSRIYNEKNEEVATLESDFYLSGETYIEDDIYADNPSKALRLEMDVYDNDNVLLTSYRENLSEDYDQIALEAGKGAIFPWNVTKVLTYAFVAGLLVLIVILFAMKRRGAASALIVILIIVSLFAFFAENGFAKKSSSKHKNPPNLGCSPAYVTLQPTAPHNNQIFAPGQLFNAGGVVSYSSCNNSATNVTISVRGPKGDLRTVPNYFSIGAIGGHGWTSGRVGAFQIGPFKAPDAPGTYNVIYSAHSQAGICGTDASAVVHIIVQGPPPTLTSTTTDSGCGEGTYYCELFRKCIPNSEQCNAANPNFELSDINPNIPATEGPVKLKASLGTNPPIGNSGYTCRVSWNESFISYDKETHCTFTSTNVLIEFDPSATTAPTFYDATSLKTDTIFKMTCHEGNDFHVQESEAICRLNWNYKEVN